MYRLMNEVTNDSRSSPDDQSVSGDEYSIDKHRPRRVRSLIKSSVEKISNEQSMERNQMTTSTKQNSSSLTCDKRPFPFGQCRVCMDKATGAHYGVPTCEGCKGFFKRSILRKEKYRCYFGDGCLITIDNRNRCKSCRFQKCLKEGMSVEGVRMGRIPKLIKEKALAEQYLSSSSTENEDPCSSIASALSPHILSVGSNFDHFNVADFDLELVDEHEVLEEFDCISFDQSPPSVSSSAKHIFSDGFIKKQVQDGFRENRSISATGAINDDEKQFSGNVLERVKNLITQLSQPIMSIELSRNDSTFIRYLRWKMIDLCNTYNGCTRQLIERMNTMIRRGANDFPGDWSAVQDIWAGLTDAIPFHVKNFITFAREIPAINEIDSDDFHKIMNNRLFDFWLMKHAPLLRNNQSYIMLPNGLQYTRKWMSKIIGEAMVEAIFDFANKINSLNLTEEDYALVFPAIICAKDESLHDQEIVHHIQCCYLYTLYTQMLTTRTKIEARTVFRNLLQIFSLLPVLNELQKKNIGSFTPELMDSRS